MCSCIAEEAAEQESLLAEHILADIENNENLATFYSSSESVKDFLHSSDVRIPLHAAKVLDPSQYMDYNFDIDGIVVELQSVTAIKSGLAYLFLPDVRKERLKNHYFLYRKHVNMQQYSKKGLHVLKSCCGVVLGHMDGGYFLNLTAMAKDIKNPTIGR